MCDVHMARVCKGFSMLCIGIVTIMIVDGDNGADDNDEVAAGVCGLVVGGVRSSCILLQIG